MMRSLYSGVAGLKNHQIRMDVLGNNVANVNTNGFKKGRVTFQDIISQSMEGAAKPTDAKGGVNPKQVGLGMSTASIDTIQRQGSLQTTGRTTDLAIQGDGFFIQKKGEETFYTRNGNFSIDSMKQLVNPANGFKVQGWNAITNIDGSRRIESSGPTEDIIVPIGEKFAAKATNKSDMISNLNSEVPAVADPNNVTDAERKQGSFWSTSQTVYDSQGKEHRMTLEFVKTGIDTWQVKANVASPTVVEGSVRLDVGTPPNLPPNVPQGQTTGVLTFNNQGAITSVSELNAADPTFIPDRQSTGDLKLNVIFNVNNGTVDPATGNPLGYEQAIAIDLGTVGQYNGITQFAQQTTTKLNNQDGYTMGYLNGITVDASGKLTGNYSNGQTREIAQVGLATFINAEGLEKAGDTNFVVSNNSGIAEVGAPGTQNRGSINSGTLEMSNVDLAEEFTDMIVTQRGFQASSRTITTSDELLRELLSLKR